MGEEDRGMTPVELGTWSFLRPGWWVLHVVGIVGVFWLGSLYGKNIFG
jgi:hypothetical protein